MKINAVEMMRDIRNQVDSEIKDLSWEEELEYLKHRNQSLTYLTQSRSASLSCSGFETQA